MAYRRVEVAHNVTGLGRELSQLGRVRAGNLVLLLAWTGMGTR